MNKNNQFEKGITSTGRIIEVYEDNFLEEIKRIGNYLTTYNYIGMDTEFPGVVNSVNNCYKDFYYKSIKANVDELKLIQVGITLCNENGEYPVDGSTWQFNMKFDYKVDKYAIESLALLSNSGIDFEVLQKRGIPLGVFAEYFMVSGLVLNEDVHWISFHGSYDFAYLLKLLTNSNLPEGEDQFTEELQVFFPNHYDIRILVRSKDNLKGGLNRLAQYLEILRIGEIHQAGSDSIVTAEVFFKLIKNQHITLETLEQERNILFGIGEGADDNETMAYTQFTNNVINMNQLNQLNQINPYQMCQVGFLNQATFPKAKNTNGSIPLLYPYMNNINNPNINNATNYNMYAYGIPKVSINGNNFNNMNNLNGLNNKGNIFVGPNSGLNNNNSNNTNQQANSKKINENGVMATYSN